MNMKVALGQFAVAKQWQANAETCLSLMAASQKAEVDLLVLPEGILARDIADPDLVLKAAQPLDGPFVSQLLAASRGNQMTTMMSVHTPAPDGRAYNVLISIRNGEIISEYRKLHLYDAFSSQESKNVTAGDDVPPLVNVAGFNVGLMTCYDVRFPELARPGARWRRRAGTACRLGERAAERNALGSAGHRPRTGKYHLY